LNSSLSESQITSITPVDVIPTKQATRFVPISQNGTFRFPSNTINDKNESNHDETIVIDQDLESSSGQDVVILLQPKNVIDSKDIKVEPLENKLKIKKEGWSLVQGSVEGRDESYWDDEANFEPEIVEIIDSKDDSDGDGFHLSNDVNREYNKVLFLPLK